MMASANPFAGCQSDWDVHNHLMTTICCDYLGIESWKGKFEKFKLKSFKYLITPNEKSVYTPYDIWSKLEDKGLIRPKQYDLLKRLVNDIDDGLVDLIKDAEERLSFLQGEEVPERKRRKIEQESDFLQTLKQKLLECNKRISESVPVSPFQTYGMLPVELLYSKVVVKTDPRYDEKGRHSYKKSKEQRGKKIIVECPDDLLFKDKEPSKRIFMTGNPAHGKTTYCVWLLQHWLRAQNTTENEQNEWDKALGKFDFVFLIRLRDVQKSRAYVTDIICEDVLEIDEESTEWLKQALKSGKYRSFIIVDGLDEWNPDEEVTRIPRFKGMPMTVDITNCVVFITMRHWKFQAVAGNVNSDDRVVEIEGLDESAIKEVTDNVLFNYYKIDKENQDDKQLYDTITKKVNQERINSIMKIPLLAVLCVRILYKEGEVWSSMTAFYKEIIEMLIERADKLHDVTIALELDANSGSLFQSFKRVLCKLGKIAYDGLISGNYSFKFPAKTLRGSLGLTELELEFSLNVGLLSMEETESKMTKRVKLYFFHTSMQEFLSALYIVENEDIQSAFLEHLFSIKHFLKFRDVLIFLSGLSTELGCSISQHIFDAANDDSEIIEYRRNPELCEDHVSKRVDELYKLQASCYKEISNEEGHDFQYKVSDIRIYSHSDINTVRTTADIISYNNTDIESMCLHTIPTDASNGIPDLLLTKYLDQTKALTSLYIYGYGTNRTIYKMCNVFSFLTSLQLISLSLKRDVISSLSTALKSTKVIETLGLKSLRYANDNFYKPALLSDVIGIVPDLPSLFALQINVRHENDKQVFAETLSRLSNIQYFEYDGVHPKDDNYDRGVVHTMCTWPSLRYLYLIGVNLGDCGLNFDHNMLKLEKFFFVDVEMSQLGWDNFIQFLLNINHNINIQLYSVNIDEQSLEKIRSSENFDITVDYTDKDGHYLECKRQNDYILYRRN